MPGARRRIVDSLESATTLFSPLIGRARGERLVVAHLDGGDALVGLRWRFGTADGIVELPVRDIVADALKLHTRAVIVAHNHPSGDPQPSTTDLRNTRALTQALRLLDIGLRDHLIFGGDGVTSFRALGLL